MRDKRTSFHIVLACATFISLAPTTVVAQSCENPPSAQRSMETHDHAFLGKLQSCKISEGQAVFSFETAEVWKGEAYPAYLFKTDDCNNKFFEKGSSYLVFAHKDDDEGAIIPDYGDCTVSRKIPSLKNRLMASFKSLFDGEKGRVPVTDPHVASLGEPIKSY